MAETPIISSSPLNDTSEPIADCCCYTDVKIAKYSFKWIIKNFSFYCRKTRDLKSAIFSTANEDKWCIWFNSIEKGDSYLSLYLQLISSNKSEVIGRFKFFILNAKGEKTNTVESQSTRNFTEGKSWGLKFIGWETLLKENNFFLFDDKLTLYCEITMMVDTENIYRHNNSIQFKLPERLLSENIASLLENKKFSDVILSVSGKEIYAHKAILAACSKVFSAMFEHEMEEKKQNRVKITDVDHEVFREMLCFIYTGKAPNLEKMATGLLAAADKYALDQLKIMCENSLCSNLSVETATSVLVLADMHGADQLKSYAIDFIINHAAEVMQTKGWKNLVHGHQHLVIEAFRASTTKYSPSEEPPHKRVKQS